MLGSHDIVTTRNFSAGLLEDVLWVAFIAKDDIKKCAWPLIRAMLFRRDDAPELAGSDSFDDEHESGFFSLTHDEEGLSLVMDDTCKLAFDDFSDTANIVYAPCRWRAFQIHLGTSAMPGVVCLLSSMLAEAHISILNVSTYDADFILVQEADVVKATAMLRDSLKRGLHGLFEQQQLLGAQVASSEVSPTPPTSASASGGSEGGESGDGLSASETTVGGGDVAVEPDSEHRDAVGWSRQGHSAHDAEGGSRSKGGLNASAAPPTVRGAAETPREGGAEYKGSAIAANTHKLYLKVLAPTLTVTRLNERSLEEVSTCLLRLLLFRRSGPAHFWCYSCVTDGDGQISLIMDEHAASLFPEEAIVGNCGLWRAVKLCGHKFNFDETGVVSAMLNGVCTQGIPVLNLSTFSTNMTIVEEASLPAALEAFQLVFSRVVWAEDELAADDAPPYPMREHDAHDEEHLAANASVSATRTPLAGAHV